MDDPEGRRRRRPMTARKLAARGKSPASHRDGRGAPVARRDDREYREYLREEQRSQRRGPQRGSRVGVAWGCIARRTGSPARQPRWGPRMQPDFHHGLQGLGHQIANSGQNRYETNSIRNGFNPARRRGARRCPGRIVLRSSVSRGIRCVHLDRHRNGSAAVPRPRRRQIAPPRRARSGLHADDE